MAFSPLIDPYGPMLNMRPIQNKQCYTADDIRAMNLVTCKHCGVKLRDENADVCKRLKCEEAEFGSDREGEA